MGVGSIVINNNPLFPDPTFSPVTILNGKWIPGTYRHTRRAMGGPWELAISISDASLKLEDYVTSFLGKEVTSWSLDGQRRVWVGMITTLKYTSKNVTITYTLDNMVNKTWARYTTTSGGVDTGMTLQYFDSILGTRQQAEASAGGATFAKSAVKNDTASQGKYGTKEGVLSLGLCPNATIAGYAAEQLLNKYSNPLKPRVEIQTGAMMGGRASLEIIASGYFRTLFWRHYNESSPPVTTASTDVIIQRVLTDVGEYITTLLTPDAGMVGPQIPAIFEMDRTGGDIILDAARAGTTSVDRAVVYADFDRNLVWERAKGGYYGADSIADVTYRVNTDKGNRTIQDQYGYIDPSEVAPRKWLILEDVLNYIPIDSGSLGLDFLENNPRASYIEEVTFQEPDQLMILPSVSGQFENVMATLNLLSGLNSL